MCKPSLTRWKELGIITQDSYDKMQEMINSQDREMTHLGIELLDACYQHERRMWVEEYNQKYGGCPVIVNIKDERTWWT